MSNVQTTKNTPQIRFKGFDEEWNLNSLGECVEFYSGLTYTPNDVVDFGGTLVLRSSNVQNGELDFEDNVYVDDNAVNSDNVEKGDIIVVVRNGSRALIGKHAVIKQEMKKTVIGAFMTGVKTEEPNFYNALFSSPKFSEEIEKDLGATINQITTGSFSRMTFNFPSSTEQTKIGELFSRIDSLIASTQKEHDKLVSLKKCMLQKMFPKKGSLVPEIRFKGFSGDWEEKRLEEVCKENLKPIPTPKNDYYRLGIRSHAKGTFHEKVLAGHGLDVDTMYIVEKDNLIVNITFAWEHAIAITDMDDEGKLVSHRFPQYKFNNDQCPSFYKYSILDNNFREKLQLASPGGAGRNRVLNLKQFKKITRIVPKTFKEQQKIGSYFQNLDNLISKQSAELEKLKNIKKTLLSKMFI